MVLPRLVCANLQCVLSSVVVMSVLVGTGAVAHATTLSLEQNFSNTNGFNLVGIGVKIDSGRASMGTITSGSSGLPEGWTQKELFWGGFTVGDNTFGSSPSTAFPSQYGFVRGVGGGNTGDNTFDTAPAHDGALGFIANFLVDDNYSPVGGDKITVLTAVFLGSNEGSFNGNNTSAMWQFTFDGTVWGPATFIEREGEFPHQEGYLFWWQNVSGSFEQLSVAVVPEPETYAMLVTGGIALVGGYLQRRKRA